MATGREVVARHRDGREFPVEIALNPVPAADGVRILAAVVDITRRREAEAALAESESRYRELATHIRDVVWTIEWPSRRVVTVNPAFESIWGWPVEALREDPQLWLDAVHPPDREIIEQALADPASSGAFDCEYRVVSRLGGMRTVRHRGYPMIDARGHVYRIASVAEDVTERRRADDLLFREKERAEITLASIGEGVVTVDAAGLVDGLNAAAEGLLGWTLEEACGRPIGEVVRILNEATGEPAETPVQACMRTRKVAAFGFSALLVRRDGSQLNIDDSAAPMIHPSGRLLGAVMVFRDVTSQRKLAREVSWHATHDELTGLVNRREFERRLALMLAHGRDHLRSFTVCYIDLDQFKIVNDTCGHTAGDELLRQFATLMRSRLRERDTLARLGGDEFGILLGECTFDQARRIAGDLRDLIEDFRFSWDDRAFRIGASIGLVPVTGGGDLAHILSAADTACYMAKERGGSRVEIVDPDGNDRTGRRQDMTLHARMQRALAGDGFSLYAQPIVALQGGAPGGFACRAAPPGHVRVGRGPGAGRVHLDRGALPRDAIDRSLGRGADVRPAEGAVVGRHGTLLDQPLGPVARRRTVPGVPARNARVERHRPDPSLLRDHRERRDRQPRGHGALRHRAAGTRLPLRARRLRRRPPVVRLPQDAADRLSQDRRTARARHGHRAGGRGDGRGHPSRRAPDGHQDDRRVGREPGDHGQAAGARHRLRAGIRRRRAGAARSVASALHVAPGLQPRRPSAISVYSCVMATSAVDLAALRRRLPPSPLTRFAPSPTGRLHLGHVVNAIFVWGLARALGGRVLLRMEDHDRDRCRPEYEAAILDDLAWLGLVPDVSAPRQSDRGADYRVALRALEAERLVYACRCSRREIAEAGGDGDELRYPGTCRDAGLVAADGLGLRVRLDDASETFEDARLGRQVQEPALQCGDLLVRDRVGQWTYQFAVTVDDTFQGIDLVVRGEDLLASTGRQVKLARLLGRRQPAVFLHHPLLYGESGLKLSKSNEDSGIDVLRAGGWPAAGVLGIAAARAGLIPAPRPLAPSGLATLFTSPPRTRREA